MDRLAGLASLWEREKEAQAERALASDGPAARPANSTRKPRFSPVEAPVRSPLLFEWPSRLSVARGRRYFCKSLGTLSEQPTCELVIISESQLGVPGGWPFQASGAFPLLRGC